MTPQLITISPIDGSIAVLRAYYSSDMIYAALALNLKFRIVKGEVDS